ncbi:Uncharacterised protein [Mycobacterium tuberculosis]|uniref:Uncharacterized protein n=1 Tax=Mycobacterium tuberculosis TaxID=1773 RepID=A0A916PCQ4_MYCTX|nr:Uncharacterised protein [Mycobacterium tuberculosis]CPA37753.1 Uncharacterised protein [Mycobacterium tuberculosis]
MAESRLICKASPLGRDSSARRPRPLNTMPLVRTVVGNCFTQVAMIVSMSGSRNGSPPVRNSSRTPQRAASPTIRPIRSAPSSRCGVLGDDETQQ